jgi:TonB-linked SusC/RagA family outer membrane protein
MKLIVLLTIVACFQATAATIAQTITLSEKNKSLTDVFTSIKQQSGYHFFWKGDDFANIKVSVHLKDATIEQTMNEVLKDLPLTYTITEQTIVIQQKKKFSLPDNSLIAAVSPPIIITGRVTNSKGEALIAVTVTIKESSNATTQYAEALVNPTVAPKESPRVTVTDAEGRYSIKVSATDKILIFSCIGMKKHEVLIANHTVINVQMEDDISALQEIQVVSTGYQSIPKERATGSFEVITAKQLQHSTSGNLLQRLAGISTSVVFNNTTSPTISAANVKSVNPTTGMAVSSQSYNGGGFTIDNMTIRGKNTLSANGSGNPLVVIDGIANPYDINLLNPDDVVSITILKDAAAASIWGSRAANGVLVVVTKKGEFNRPPVVSFSGNVSISEKPDLYYLKQMSTSDYIDAEIYGFQESHTSLPTPDIHNGYTGRLVSPVAEILDAMNKGTLSSAAGNAQIDALRQNDIRKDETKYLLRNAVDQNYNLSISGGTKSIAYVLSGGYQNSLNNTVKSNSDRLNLSYNMQMKPIKNLDISTGISFNASNKNGLGPLSLSLPVSGLSNLSPYYYPYSKLADDHGNAWAIPYYRPGFISALNTAYGSKILDYTYKPLDDLNESYSKARTQNLGFNLNVGYKFLPELSAQLTYNYNLGSTYTEDFYSVQSLYMRDLINRYTDPTTFKRNIPLGGFFNPGNSDSYNQTLRGIVSFNKTWNSKHEVNAILGTDIFDSKSTTNPTNGYYGYNPVTLQTANVTYNTYFNTLFDPNYGTTAQLPNVPGISFLRSRSRTASEFLNAAYTYDRRYTLSGSIRKDGSSAFANETNKTGTPFYSVGASWEINNEKFYHVAWLPYLKLRTTFGYNGNSNPGATAYSVIGLSTNTDYRTLLPYASVSNLSNSLLRPERTAVTNIALDFRTKDNRFSGSIEYYLKITKDLLSFSPLDPTLGSTGQIYNVGNIRGSGIDLNLRSLNLKTASFTWESIFNFSNDKVIVTKNYVSSSVGSISVLTGTYYYKGKPLSTLYAFQWAGLNPTTGAARAINGTSLAEDDYSIPSSALKAMGSSVPVYYGNLANTFTYGGFSLWANINYKLGYYQRRSVNMLFLNGTQMSSYSPQQVAGAEYANRWQKPGDEKFTNVPSRDINRGQSNDNIYQYADINVYKADNIRIQEINLNYTFRKGTTYIKNPRIYITVPINLVIWRANKLGLDPDVYDYPIPRAYGFGFSANF